MPFPSPGDLPDPGIEPRSPAFQADALTSEPLSHLCPTLCNPMAIARQTPPSMGFSRQEYWSGLPFPSPGDLPEPGIEPGSPALQADALTSEPPGKTLRDTQKLIAAWQKMEEKHMVNCQRYVKLATWTGDVKSLPIYL